MKKDLLLKILAVAIVSSCFSSCAIVEDLNADMYKLTSVPEEGGIHFTLVSSEDEKIVHPAIFVNPTTKQLNWYAAPLLTLDPKGEQIAYLCESNSFSNINIRQLSGGKLKIQRTFNKNVMDMTFSPDGKNITFSELKGDNSDIYKINATEGAAVVQITASDASELGPVYDPSGTSLYYSASDGGRYYIWNINLETGIKTQFAEGFTPVLTTDTKNLIITRNNKDTQVGEIWMINLEKGTETLILSDIERGFSSPVLSPDGTTIACVGTSKKTNTTPNNLDIYTVKLDGTHLTQLTFHGGHDVSPIWSRDGESIYFIAQRGNAEGRFGIWKMNVK